MRILVNGATATMDRLAHTAMGRHHLGRLTSPSRWGNITDDLPWAADNDAFHGFDADKFTAMLDRICDAPHTRLLWVACPDVVGNWRLTRAAFAEWSAAITKRQLPVAVVAQDGATLATIPWMLCHAVFIGGTDLFKEGQDAFEIGHEAKQRGKMLHVGRVNSYRRCERWLGLADTIDGSQFSWFSETYLPDWLQWLSFEGAQARLDFEQKEATP